MGPFSTKSYKLMWLDTTREGDNQEYLSVELIEGHWPSDKVLKQCFKEKGWTYGTVIVLSERIKMIVRLREDE